MHSILQSNNKFTYRYFANVSAKSKLGRDPKAESHREPLLKMDV